jgi:hypothetical protein
MKDWNLLILTVYIISVIYVFYRAIKSVDNQLRIELDKDSLAQQIDAQGLKDLIEIKFKPKKRYQADQVRDLSIDIENKSQTYSISVDWDQSSLTNFDGRSRRVIRLMPGMTLDLFQPQALSVIAPSKTLKEYFTAEDALKRNSEGVLEIASPLFSPDKLRKASERGDQFLLRLILQVSDPASGTGGGRLYALLCEFKVIKLPWTDALG